MEFKNRKNKSYEIDGKTIWHSRSVAVVGVIVVYKDNIPYILVSKRGENTPEEQGKMNLVTGYLDWDETAPEAFCRECWEETGFNVERYSKEFEILKNNLNEPWQISTNPKTKNKLQNVSLRYGVILKTEKELPELTTEYNEIEGESEEPMWMPLSNINNYKWAFNHDKLIQEYVRKYN
jgi:8-oxo-dGTP pyrophosphatase MutT (NUDIX family)